MSNSQSASSKLHPFNNVKNQSNVIAAVHKKDNLYTASGKENVDINKKQTNIRNKKASHSETSETKSHNSSLLSKVKNLISLWESSKKEETEKHFTKHGEGSTRVQSTVEEKEFPKTEFKIYTGAKKKNKPTYGSKHCSEILKEEPKRIKRVETSRNVLIEKRIQLLKPRRLENQTVNDRVKNLRVEGRVNEDINETPVDVLPSLINRKKKASFSPLP